jgi:hypothetical protein
MSARNVLYSMGAAAGAIALLGLALFFLSGPRPNAARDAATPDLQAREASRAEPDVPEAASLPEPPRAAGAEAPPEVVDDPPPAVLTPGKYLVRGRIVESASAGAGGAAAVPVPGVAVTFRRHPRRARLQDQPIPQTRVTGGDGVFAFGGISWGMWLRLDIDAPGRALKTLSCDLPDPQGEGEIDLGDLVVEPAVTLGIEVVSPDGDPVPGAKVMVKSPIEPRLEAAGMFESHKEAVETEPGRYIVERMPPGIPRVQVEASGFSLFREHLAVPKEGGPIVARLQWGLAIAGVVTDPGGKPIADATVAIEGPRLVFPYPKTRTSARGEFRFDQLSVGVYDVRVRARGFGELFQRGLKAGGESPTIVLEPEAVVAGRVVAKDGGSPIAGARVALVPAGIVRESTTGADGGFRIEGIAPGEYWLTADHEGHAFQREGPLSVAAGQVLEDRVVQLEHGRQARGRLTDGTTGEGIAGVWVTFTLLDQDPGSPATRRLVKTDTDGSYIVPGLAEGMHGVSVRARGYLGDAARTVEVQGEDIAGLDLALQAGNSVSGRVADAAGRPIAGASVRVSSQPRPGGRPPPGLSGRFAQTDAGGVYVLEGLPAGKDSRSRPSTRTTPRG